VSKLTINSHFLLYGRKEEKREIVFDEFFNTHEALKKGYSVCYTVTEWW
jgi:hypothetical protein